jgi:aminopeptidase N
MSTVPRLNRPPGVSAIDRWPPCFPDASARLLLTTLALLVALLSVSSPAYPAHATTQAPAASYRLDAAVDLNRATVAVSESVQFRNVVGVALETLVFRVVPNALGTFELTSLSVDGQPVERRLDGSVLELSLPRPLLPGQSTQVDLRYSLAVPREPGRMTSTPRSMALGYWFPMLAVHRGDWDRRQFVDVGDATFSEVADFDLTISTSSPAHVVATGQRAEQDGQRWRFQASAVRDVALAVSPDFVVRRVTLGGTTLEVAAYSEERAAFYVTRAAEFLRWTSEKLGPYPYPTLVVADADLPASFGGLEYPGLIFLSRAYPVGAPPEGGSLDGLYLHEILHQWFYSLVGNDQIADPWLDEAFVTYLAYRYYREVRPDLAPAVFERTIAGGTGGAVDGTVYDFPSDPPYFGVVYRRGARFLEALHARMGDGPFWALLREHIATYRDRISYPRAFLDRAQSTSPTPVGPLIAEYFSYPTFRTATPRNWTVEARAGTWSGSATVFVAADFPVTRVQVFLDQRRMADGPSNNLTLDLADVEPGSYVLLVRVWDHDEVLFERGRRVEISR